MAVKFISYVDQNEKGEWFIKLTDTLEDSSVICNDLDEYEKQIGELGGEYGNEIEVEWQKSPILSPTNYQDINDKMALMQQKYQQEIDEMNNQQGNQDQETMGFNPNA